MSLLQKIDNVQAIALAGLERATSNVSMIQNIRITTGQILNFASQVRAQGLSISLPIPNLSISYASPFYYAFDGVEESNPLTGSETIAITKMSDQSIRFNLRNQYVLTSTFSDFQNTTLPNIITTNENQNTILSNLGNTILSFLQTHEFNTTIANHLLVSDFNNYSSNVSLTLNNIISVNNNQNTSISSITNTIGSLLQISSFNNTINNYLSIPSFNTYNQFVSSFLTNTFNLDITQNSRLDSIESTLPSYLQTQYYLIIIKLH
jgi:hypothetical protein